MQGLVIIVVPFFQMYIVRDWETILILEPENMRDGNCLH